MPTESFVSADKAAEFLGITRRLLLSMARMGVAGAYAVGTGKKRRHWVFRISELSSSAVPASQAQEQQFPQEHKPHGTIARA